MTHRNQPWVLGISASHNGAVCLLRGDEIVVAVQEERLSRKKRDWIWGKKSARALDYCLSYAGIRPVELSAIVFCASGQARAPQHDLTQNPVLGEALARVPVFIIPHHLGHALSAFATSGFEEAAVLVIDGAGSPSEDFTPEEAAVVIDDYEFGLETISLYGAAGTKLTPLEKHIANRGEWLGAERLRMPRYRSLGGMYAATSIQIFGDADEAGKVMGLAPYGEPDTPVSDFYEVVNNRFVYHDKLPARFRYTERWPAHETEYKNLARSTQAALEESLLYLARRLYELRPSENLCYSGGVALNSVANERLIGESAFRNVYIMPAAEDSGVAVGAAYYGLWQLTGRNTGRRLKHDAVGREYGPQDVARAVERTPGVQVVKTGDVMADVVDLLCGGKIVGWFQGRSELGPRALGQRSILCDPRRADGKAVLNGRVKYREAFRPFAPVVLREEAERWFELDGKDPASPFMLRVSKFRREKTGSVPAVVHVDGTGRLQTVSPEANGRLYELIKKFGERTGVPILLNTSFNVKGEPIVETPEDALKCFLSTGMNYCVLHDTLVKKRERVLFGEHEVSWEQYVKNQVARAERAAAASNCATPARPAARPLSAYAGTFEHPIFGLLTVRQEGEHLTGTLTSRYVNRGRWSLPLARHFRDTFVVTGELFRGCRFYFIPTGNDDIDCVSFRMEGPRDLILTRMPDGEAAASTPLRELVGEYEQAGNVMRVEQRGDHVLTAKVPGQPAYELTVRGAAQFNLRNIPGYSLNFRTDAAGSVTGVVVTQPNGIFHLMKTGGGAPNER
jgi:carbamoyltransferase